MQDYWILGREDGFARDYLQYYLMKTNSVTEDKVRRNQFSTFEHNYHNTKFLTQINNQSQINKNVIIRKHFELFQLKYHFVYR